MKKPIIIFNVCVAVGLLAHGVAVGGSQEALKMQQAIGRFHTALFAKNNVVVSPISAAEMQEMVGVLDAVGKYFREDWGVLDGKEPKKTLSDSFNAVSVAFKSIVKLINTIYQQGVMPALPEGARERGFSSLYKLQDAFGNNRAGIKKIKMSAIKSKVGKLGSMLKSVDGIVQRQDAELQQTFFTSGKVIDKRMVLKVAASHLAAAIEKIIKDVGRLEDLWRNPNLDTGHAETGW